MTNLKLYIDINPDVLVRTMALLGGCFDNYQIASSQINEWLQMSAVIEVNDQSLFYDDGGLITQPWEICKLEGVNIFMIHAINKNGELGWCEVYFEPAYKSFEQFNDEQARALVKQVIYPILH